MDEATVLSRLNFGSVADWAMVCAALLAAFATFSAVAVALVSSAREHRRSLAMQKAEWERQEEEIKVRAAIWATAGCRELFLAHGHLRDTAVYMMDQLSEQQVELAMLGLVEMRSGVDHFALLRSRLATVEEFEPEVAIAVLNVIAGWDRLSVATPKRWRQFPKAWKSRIARTRALEVKALAERAHEAHDLLAPIAKRLPFVQDASAEEAIKAFSRKRDQMFDEHPVNTSASDH